MHTSHSKVIAVSIICLATLAVAIFFTSDKVPTTPQAQLTTKEESEYIPIYLSPDVDKNTDTDSDNDGLKDWEELLLATDPQNPDTDGDGSTDLQEKSQSRDPLKKGPNDKVASIENGTIGDTSIAPGFTKNSATDNFSKKFFENYLVAKQGGTIDPSTQENIIEDVVAQANNDLTSTKRYTKDELTLIFEPTREDITLYGNTFAATQLKKLRDIGMVASTTQSLPRVAEEYRKMSEDLFAMKVPAEVADSHLKIINNLYIIHESYLALATYEKDPIKALFAIKEHKRIADEQVTLYTRIKNYFTKNAILFDNTEHARFWNTF